MRRAREDVCSVSRMIYQYDPVSSSIANSVSQSVSNSSFGNIHSPESKSSFSISSSTPDMSAGRNSDEEANVEAENIGSLQSGIANTTDSPDAAEEILLLELMNDYNFMQKLENKLQCASINNLKDLLLAFDISYEDRCKVLKSRTPCVMFFENLSMKKPELSLRQLRDDIENKTANPNKSIFKKIDGDIKKGLVSFKLDSTLGELIADHKAWHYILQNIAGNLIPEKENLLISWENIASLHDYESCHIANFKKVASSKDESPLQKFLSLLCTRKSSITVSEFVNKLKEINREDAARLVESWLKNLMYKLQSSLKDSAIGIAFSTFLSDEQKNFVKIAKIILDVFPKYLRILFKSLWDKKYPEKEEWCSGKESDVLYNELTEVVKNAAKCKGVLERLKNGNDQKWNTSTLVFAILDTHLELVKGCRDRKDWIHPLRTSEKIRMLCEIDSTVFSHSSGMSLSLDTLEETVARAKSISEGIFPEDALKEIDDILDSSIEAEESQQKQRGNLKHDLGNRVRKMEGTLLESKHKLQLPIDVINFVKISKILLDVVQKCMRKYFLKQWCNKYPNQKWQSNAASGEMMVQQLSDVIRTNDYDKILEKIKSGNEMQWDIATLAFVLLDSKLKLINDEDKGASGIRREVERLKNTENMFYAIDLGFTCPTDEYKEIISNIKSAVEHIFDKTAVREIDDIDNSPMERKIKIKRRQLQDKEESRKGKGDKSHDILKDHPLILEFATEEANFMTITDLLWSVVPRYLREYFKEKWNKQYTNQKWQSNISSGECLVRTLPDGIKSTKSLKMIKALETGNEQNWSIGTLVFLLLCPDLKLLEACRPKHKRKTPLRPSEEIDLFRRVKDAFFSDHRSDMSCKFEEFREVAAKIKDFVQHTLCEDARTEIVDMIEEQRKRNPDLEESDEDLPTGQTSISESPPDHGIRLGSVKSKLEDHENRLAKLENSVRGGTKVQRGQPMSKLEIERHGGKLKKKYVKLGYEEHYVYKIKNGPRGKDIYTMPVGVNEFAVKLTLSHDFTHEDSFKNENRRYFGNLIGARRADIKMEKLLDDEDRVIFIRGIAGMGKTVLSKQLVWGWANDKMYTNFKLCIMFECRELNSFVRTEGAKLNKREQFKNFIKKTFSCELEDVEGVLFVVDGLDELFDIHDIDSIIWQLLLKKSKYSGSRIILTGRPHVESKLQDREVGRIRKVEIQGLTEKQINDYIEKFTSSKEEILNIKKAKDSSKGYLPLLHVPQFLNTFCYVAVLSEGNGVHSTTELYCWTLYLLLKEHGDKEEPSKKQISKIFEKHSEELTELATICYDLLQRNEIIFTGELESRFTNGRKFFASCFVDVSDCNDMKYQFKHLTLMEFLAALHACRAEKPMKVIKDILEKGFIDTVVYACELIARLSCDGIIKKMLNSIANIQKLDVKLNAILGLVGGCSLDERIKFQRSLDILVSFLVKSGNEEESIFSCIKNLRSDHGFKSTVTDSNNLYKITNYLERKFNSSDGDLHKAFGNIRVGELIVNEEKTVLGAKYLGTVDIISFSDMVFNVSNAQSKIEEIGDGQCTIVWIENCEFDENEEKRIGRKALNLDLDELVIWDSRLKENSFSNSCEWGTSSKKFMLDQLKFKVGWWEILTDAVERKSRTKDLKMKDLILTRCNPSIDEEFQKRV